MPPPRPLDTLRCAALAAAAFAGGAHAQLHGVPPAPVRRTAPPPPPGPTQPAGDVVWMNTIPGEVALGAAWMDGGPLLVANGRYGVDAFTAEGQPLPRGVVPGTVTDPELVSHAASLAPIAGGGFALAEGRRHQVLLFDGRGALLRRIGGDGDQPGRFRDPAGMAIQGGRLAVADAGNDRVQVFDLAAPDAPPLVIGGRGGEPGRFRRPLGVAWDGAGRLWVADSDNHRLQRFRADGSLDLCTGTRGAMPGQFERPVALAWSEGSLLVVDHYNHRVQRLSSTGEPQSQWGQHSVRPREGDGRIHYPEAIAVDDRRGLVAVAEPFERRVQVFRRSAPGELVPLQPPPAMREGVASHFGPGVGLDGRTLAAWEPESAAVIIFDLRQETPGHVTTFGSPGTRPGQIGRIAALAVDALHDQVLLADPGNDRLAEWQLVRDPAAPMRFDPFMARLSRAWSLPAIAAATAARFGGPARIEPVGLALLPGAPGGGGRTLALLDRLRGRAIVLDESMSPVALAPAPPEAPLVEPVAIARDGTDGFLLLDAAAPARTVVATDASGAVRGAFAAPAALASPQGVARLRGGRVVITDGADRLWYLERDGSIAADPLIHGGGDGQLWSPRGAAAADDGSLYVVDWGNHRIQRFDADGEWEARFSLGRPSVRPRLPDAAPAPPPPARATLPAIPGPVAATGPWPRELRSLDGAVRATWRPVTPDGAPLAAIPLREPFALEVTLEPALTAPEVDAIMPHHGHGMNVAPEVRPAGAAGVYRASPLLFHMPGAWEVHIDVIQDRVLRRLQDAVTLEAGSP